MVFVVVPSFTINKLVTGTPHCENKNKILQNIPTLNDGLVSDGL